MHFLLIFLTPFVIIPKISLSFFMPYNYKTRPHALYMHKDGIKSRVTTLIHRPLTRSASPSIWQYFCNITVAPGAAYWSSKFFFCSMTQNIFFCLFLIMFNAQLVNVFSISFPCASHHPAALCMFRSYLLLSVIAVAVCNCLHMSIIIKVVFGNVNVKFVLPVLFYIFPHLYGCAFNYYNFLSFYDILWMLPPLNR